MVKACENGSRLCRRGRPMCLPGYTSNATKQLILSPTPYGYSLFITKKRESFQQPRLHITPPLVEEGDRLRWRSINAAQS